MPTWSPAGHLRRAAIYQRIGNESPVFLSPFPWFGAPLRLQGKHPTMWRQADLGLSFQSLASYFPAHPGTQACHPTSSRQLDKLLLPLEAGGGEGGQGPAHGCGCRAARCGENRGGLQSAPGVRGSRGSAAADTRRLILVCSGGVSLSSCTLGAPLSRGFYSL